MTININLLPWRSHKLHEKKRHFITMIASSTIFALLFVFITHAYIKKLVLTQDKRNQYILSEITHLHKQITEITNLKERKKELLARMKIISNLQSDRPKIVEIFDSIVRVVPKGVYFEHLSKTGETIAIKGLSEDNSKVSKLMRGLDKQRLFDNPNLVAVKGLGSGEGSRFHITVQKVSPSSTE